MAKSSFRRLLLFIIPVLTLALSCSTGPSSRIARKHPVAQPAGDPQKSPVRPQQTAAAKPSTAPAAEPPAASASSGAGTTGAAEPVTVDQIIAKAKEAYDAGLEALNSGDTDAAREHFDRAVQIFLASGAALDQERQLRRAYEKMVEDIAAMERELDETAAPPPDATPSPTEKLDQIDTELTPEEAEKELESVTPEIREVSFDIPMVVNDKVLGWIEIFKNRGEFRSSFIGGYQRYGWYEEMIHRTFKEEGLPADLIYMAFLESTYKTSAYSRARAKGIWQFMTPTAREYGLKVNRYVDERSHPEKSTRAAARYMKNLHSIFGDWHLAIAAYNTGAGNIMRAQRRSGKTSFWDLARTRYMRQETKNFVPAILALALIGKDPVKYGFEGLQHNPTLQFDRVTVDGPTRLSMVAGLAQVSEEEIRFLNPHLRLGVTPPGEKGYEILVPAGRGEPFVAAYQAVPESERFVKVAKIHTVRRGETLATIAARYGTTVKELKRANGIGNPHRIRVGAQLNVSDVGAWDERSEAARVSRRVARSKPYHVVRRGDTLSGIARAYRVPLKSLMTWNDLKESSVLKRGDRIRVAQAIPAVEKAAPTTVASAGQVSVPGGGQRSPDPAGTKITYRVRRGDNLFRIALKHGTSVDNLKAWNNLVGEVIRVGDLLVIYPN